MGMMRGGFGERRRPPPRSTLLPPEADERPRVRGGGHRPVPFGRPFDSAQGERNPHPAGWIYAPPKADFQHGALSARSESGKTDWGSYVDRHGGLCYKGGRLWTLHHDLAPTSMRY